MSARDRTDGNSVFETAPRGSVRSAFGLRGAPAEPGRPERGAGRGRRRGLRGLFGLAFIAAMTLAVSHGLGLDLPSLARRFVTSMGSTSAAAISASVKEIQNGKLAITDGRLDVGLGESYFAKAEEPLRTRLVESWRAYLSRDFARALALLDSVDGTDLRVLLMRGRVMIAVLDPDAVRSGVALLKRAADRGEPRAMTILGALAIAAPWGLSPDLDGGRALLERASEAGDAVAPRILGEGHIDGWAGRVDAPRAVRLLRLASDRGDQQGTFRLAALLLQGTLVTKDATEGERLLSRAAEAGHVRAQGMLGVLKLTHYRNGLTDDPSAALLWLERAAARYEPEAILYLGLFFVKDGARTGHLDQPRGVALFRRCAELTQLQGCVSAYANAVEKGIGTALDPVKAYALFTWLNKVEKHPDRDGRLENLAKTLSAEEIARAQAMAAAMTSPAGRLVLP